MSASSALPQVRNYYFLLIFSMRVWHACLLTTTMYLHIFIWTLSIIAILALLFLCMSCTQILTTLNIKERRVHTYIHHLINIIIILVLSFFSSDIFSLNLTLSHNRKKRRPITYYTKFSFPRIIGGRPMLPLSYILRAKVNR